MKRSEIREAAFLLIFEKMFNDESIEAIIETAKEVDEYEINEEAQKLFTSVIQKSDELDAIIAGYSEKRQLSRIPRVSLAILRLALYEILYDEKVPQNVAISEAVILSKKFSFDADVQFVNGVLGAYSRSKEAKE
jgi:N utilization substance protein B